MPRRVRSFDTLNLCPCHHPPRYPSTGSFWRLWTQLGLHMLLRGIASDPNSSIFEALFREKPSANGTLRCLNLDHSFQCYALLLPISLGHLRYVSICGPSCLHKRQKITSTNSCWTLKDKFPSTRNSLTFVNTTIIGIIFRKTDTMPANSIVVVLTARQDTMPVG